MWQLAINLGVVGGRLSKSVSQTHSLSADLLHPFAFLGEQHCTVVKGVGIFPPTWDTTNRLMFSYW